MLAETLPRARANDEDHVVLAFLKVGDSLPLSCELWFHRPTSRSCPVLRDQDGTLSNVKPRRLLLERGMIARYELNKGLPD